MRRRFASTSRKRTLFFLQIAAANIVLVLVSFKRLFVTDGKREAVALVHNLGAEKSNLQAKNTGDLCEALVQASRDRMLTFELLTSAQYPSAQVDLDIEPSTSDEASLKDMGCGGIKALAEPKRLLDVFLFGGGEVDTLEIRLLELQPVVDKFIVVTSNVTHHGEPAFDIIRPLLETERFRRYKEQIYVFEHRRQAGTTEGANDFSFEGEKEIAVARYLEEKYEDDNVTLVIFGHVDEIPAREDVWKVRNCEFDLPGNFGIWFPYGNLNFAFRSSFPARNMPWTLGDPGVTMANSLKDMLIPRGRMSNVLGRGFHATNYCFPPQVLMKTLTATEYGGYNLFVDGMINAKANNITCEQYMHLVRHNCLQDPVRVHGARMKRVSDLLAEGEHTDLFYVPFALRTPNFARYPSWDPSGRATDWRAYTTWTKHSS